MLLLFPAVASALQPYAPMAAICPRVILLLPRQLLSPSVLVHIKLGELWAEPTAVQSPRRNDKWRWETWRRRSSWKCGLWVCPWMAQFQDQSMALVNQLSGCINVTINDESKTQIGVLWLPSLTLPFSRCHPSCRVRGSCDKFVKEKTFQNLGFEIFKWICKSQFLDFLGNRGFC